MTEVIEKPFQEGNGEAITVSDELTLTTGCWLVLTALVTTICRLISADSAAQFASRTDPRAWHDSFHGAFSSEK